MNWLLTVVLCVMLVEVALRLPFSKSLSMLTRSNMRALKVLRTKHVSDHWKEKAMGAYARKTFTCSSQIGLYLGIVLAIAAAVVFGFDLMVPGFAAFILSWTGIVLSLVAASLYFFGRRIVCP